MPTETTLSQNEIVRGATNAPELSTNVVQVGGREFKVVDLSYDDYMVFLTKLQPLLMALTASVTSRFGLNQNVDLASVTPASIIQFCGKDLPELACIVCRQTDSSVSVNDMKVLAKTPFAMAKIVMAQIKQNRMIQDFSDFFVQMLPLLAEVMGVEKKSSTNTTPSS
jgi:hypothetical protein